MRTILGILASVGVFVAATQAGEQSESKEQPSTSVTRDWAKSAPMTSSMFESEVHSAQSYGDLQGIQWYGSDEEPIYLVSLKLGVNSDGMLCTAYEEYALGDGSIESVDHTANCARVFDELADARGFMMPIGGSVYTVEDFTLGFSMDGRVYLLAFDAYDASGERHQYGPPAGVFSGSALPPTCKWETKRICQGSGSCTGTCPAAGDSAPCNCTGGTGGCNSGWSSFCPTTNGTCPAGQACTEQGINCNCQ